MKFLVLLLSVAAVSAYVWHASQRKQTTALQSTPDNTENVDELMLSGSKSAAVFRQEDAKELLDNQPDEAILPLPVEKPSVSDEEVKRVRDNMLRSSKSGSVMLEEDVRKMLEKQKESQSQQPAPTDLIPSSKVLRIVSPEESKEIAEKMKQWKKQEKDNNEPEQK